MTMLKNSEFKYSKKKIISLSFLLLFLISAYILISYMESKSVFSTESEIEKTIEKMKIYVGGEAAGIKLLATGVLVVENEQNNGVLVGDIILEIEGNSIDTYVALQKHLQEYQDKEITLKIDRNGDIIYKKIKAIYSEANDMYELGLWVKDSSAGVGTISFYDKKAGRFAALGHGITETSDNVVLPIKSGGLVRTKITDVRKGESNSPGDMRGTLYKEVIGQIRKNTINGIYGDIENNTFFEGKEEVEVCKKLDVKEGKAKIYCTLLDNKVEEYEIKIEKVLYGSKNNKNMIIQITDEKLLDQTGGIIQGMSGSPIVQNGKLVGAITHVFLNDPKEGYGVFAENMIKDMDDMK